MCAFQPDALTISRGDLWRNRREFAEAVLDTARPRHRLADRFGAVARGEAEALLAEARRQSSTTTPGTSPSAGSPAASCFGDSARDDEPLTDAAWPS